MKYLIDLLHHLRADLKHLDNAMLFISPNIFFISSFRKKNYTTYKPPPLQDNISFPPPTYKPTRKPLMKMYRPRAYNRDLTVLAKMSKSNQIIRGFHFLLMMGSLLAAITCWIVIQRLIVAVYVEETARPVPRYRRRTLVTRLKWVSRGLYLTTLNG